MSWNIVRHAFNMVFGNLFDAIKVSVIPLLLAVLLSVLAFWVSGIRLVDIGDMQSISAAGNPTAEEVAWLTEKLWSLAGAGVCAAIFVSFAVAWIAVLWHRFVLLEEYPTILPRLEMSVVGRYFLRAMGIALIMLAAWVVVGFVLKFVIEPIAPVIGSLGMVAAVILLTWFYMRLGITLPSIALGRGLGLADGYQATRRLSRTIMGVCGILMGIGLAGSIVLQIISMGLPVIGLVLDLAFQWVMMMVGVSILTTLYGHLIEGRNLSY